MEINESLNPLISVILPAFNEEKNIRRAADSLLKQTYKNIEIIIIDDGSTDATEKICRELSDKDSRIRFWKKKNEGLSAARNLGLKYATGRYVAFLDADDYCLPDYIKKMYKSIVCTGSDLCVCGYYTEYADNRRVTTHHEIMGNHIQYSRPEAEKALIKGYIGFHAWGKLYKSEIIKGISYPEGKVYEDIYTFPAILDKCRKVSVLKERLIIYTQNANSIVNRQNLKSEYCAFDAHVKVFRKYLSTYPYLAGYLLRDPVCVALRIKVRCLLSKENKESF